ncbi:MAG: hypothetical protein ACHQDF_04260 [Chitinophagales bacterium]
MKISKEQQSVLAIIAGLLAIALIKHRYAFLWAAGIMAICFPFGSLNRPVHKVWTAVSKVLGTISGQCILFILFFLFLVPLSALRKLFGKQEAMRNFRGNATSHFHQRNHLFIPKDFLNPW